MPTKMSTSRNGVTGDVMADFGTHANRIREDIATLASSISDAGSALSEDAKYNASAKAIELKQASQDAIRDLRNQLDAVEKQMSGQLRDRPFTTLAIAAGVGFLFAVLTRR